MGILNLIVHYAEEWIVQDSWEPTPEARLYLSQGTCYVSFPIARFRCRQRGRKNPSHKTFSLLPYELIPYSKYSIDFVFQVLTSLYIEGKSQKEVLDFITTLSIGSICLEASILPKFKSYIIHGIEKLVISRNFKSFEVYLDVKDKKFKDNKFFELLKQSL